MLASNLVLVMSPLLWGWRQGWRKDPEITEERERLTGLAEAYASGFRFLDLSRMTVGGPVSLDVKAVDERIVHGKRDGSGELYCNDRTPQAIDVVCDSDQLAPTAIRHSHP
jgi:hypothetical protein